MIGVQEGAINFLMRSELGEGGGSICIRGRPRDGSEEEQFVGKVELGEKAQKKGKTNEKSSYIHHLMEKKKTRKRELTLPPRREKGGKGGKKKEGECLPKLGPEGGGL